jgi:hypothetical protein
MMGLSVEQWSGIGRQILTIVGTFLMAWGYVDAGTWSTASGALTVLFTGALTLYLNSRNVRIAAVASTEGVKGVVTTPQIAAEIPAANVVKSTEALQRVLDGRAQS